ncbi:HNH endonuclease [Mycolicibacterium houstonense]
MRRAHEERKRARKAGAYVEPVYRKRVFNRDGYRCHLCGKKTDQTKKVPHPKAPTLDHIIPLASGGTHEPSNCRCACFLCNSLKGDRGGGEQLLLIG